VPSLVSPKLRRLFKAVLGYDPNDEELSREISDERFIKNKSRVEQIAKILRENEFIIVGKFPAGSSVFLLADASMESIKEAIELVNSETSEINSDIK
jgi:diphthamide synthase subunit DPH2